jgi:mono/diheme cytochrome c family protein
MHVVAKTENERPMFKCVKGGLVIVLIAVIAGAAALALIVEYGFSARAEPSAVEAFVARRLRRLATPRSAREARNPISKTPDILSEARAHFADHCAICHANDGSGKTEIGKNIYPKAPDMREPSTQSLTDGELFYIIHNGIRLTGMPAWGSDDVEKDHDSWKLVHFIRHLPHLTPDELNEMRKMNPKSQHEIEEEEEIRQFLMGAEAEVPQAQHH